MNDKELISEFRKLRVVDISDACDAMGMLNQVMDSKMRPVEEGHYYVGAPQSCMAGFAKTQRMRMRMTSVQSFDNFDDYAEALYSKDANDGYMQIMENIEDKVIVTDFGGAAVGMWGSDNSMALFNRGCVGIIIDGGCRDSAEVKKEGLRIWSTVRSCRHFYGRMDGVGYAVDEPITCAGVEVAPNDVVCADDDGVVVVPREKAETVLQIAQRILKRDQAVRRQNYEEAGMTPDSTLGA